MYMKNFLIAITLCLCCMVSCKEPKKDKNKEPEQSMAQSYSKINELSVVIDNELWKGKIGDTIRKYFGAEVPGLPQQEPLFSMRQMPKTAFTGQAKRNRIFLWIKKGDEPGHTVLENKYANPQKGAMISGTETEIIDLIHKHQETIISEFKLMETKEKQRRIQKSLERIPQLSQKLGITLKIPTAYRIAKEEDKFFWIRKDIPQGSMNLMIYEVPLGTNLVPKRPMHPIFMKLDWMVDLHMKPKALGKLKIALW